MDVIQVPLYVILFHSNKKYKMMFQGKKKTMWTEIQIISLTSLTCRKSFASNEMAMPGTGTSSSWAAL